MTIDWASNEVRALVLVFAVLAVGSVVRLFLSANADPEKARARQASLLTWWVLAILMASAVVLGRPGVCLLLGVASFLGLREWSRLVVEEPADRASMVVLFALVPVVYLGIELGWGRRVVSLVPVAAVLLVATAQILQGRTHGYLRSTGALVLGALTLIFGLSHAALLMDLVRSNPVAGGAGFFLFLIILTELNDISQALVGRRIGRHKITPQVSPNKTWEGLLGGLSVTLGASILIAPLLTPLAAPGRFTWPVLAGLVIVVSGFLGDLNMSAVKRDVGVKDSSDLLPGMGGILDRMDSLTFTAPCFYWFILVPFLV